jgi:7-carboxy-7-deazaguanine synthase
MNYRVNDIFYSLQGEGHNTGRSAIFIRMSGCNLQCEFCDTDFRSFQLMDTPAIVSRARNLVPSGAWADASCRPMVVLTGGEPTLQVDNALVDALHDAGFSYVAMETNGTKTPPDHLDWVTVSPKQKVVVERCDELKCVFDGSHDVERWPVQARYYYLQPCDVGDAKENRRITALCMAYIMTHPKWRLSLQTHKLLGFK